MNSILGHFLSPATFFFGCIVALAFHEAAHIVIARALWVRVKRIGISWRGPYIVREPGEPGANLLIAIAGPLINLVLATLFWTGAPTFAQINLVLGLSNLLPLPGSDGSRAWSALTQIRSAVQAQTT
jgi:Zn-dependent protease